MMLPTIVLWSPIVALEPIDQCTLPAEAPFARDTEECGKLVNVEAAMNMNSALLTFWASNVSVRPLLRRNAPGAVQYTPGKSVAPPEVK